MTALDWFLTVILFSIYLACLFTVCMLTFKKGYFLLGIIGIFFPFLWLIGAILPPKLGSQYEAAESARRSAQTEQMTS